MEESLPLPHKQCSPEHSCSCCLWSWVRISVGPTCRSRATGSWENDVHFYLNTAGALSSGHSRHRSHPPAILWDFLVLTYWPAHRILWLPSVHPSDGSKLITLVLMSFSLITGEFEHADKSIFFLCVFLFNKLLVHILYSFFYWSHLSFVDL